MMPITLKNPYLTAQINPNGAELVSLKTPQREYIWEGDPAFWGKHSPVLFPIVGTLQNNSYRYQDQQFQLSRHGFARDMVFEIVEQDESSALFSLKASATTMAMYPFPFKLQLHYSLEGHRLKISYMVSNDGNESMPFSIGAHPAFALPENFDTYALVFDKDVPLQYHLLESDLLSEKTTEIVLVNGEMPLTYALFENDALVFKALPSDSVTILENTEPLLTVHCRGFPSLGIWTKPRAPFICIEPWFGYSDTPQSNGNLFEKEGMQVLEGHAVFDCQLSIEIF